MPFYEYIEVVLGKLVFISLAFTDGLIIEVSCYPRSVTLTLKL